VTALEQLYNLNALDEEGMLTCMNLNKHTHAYTHTYIHTSQVTALEQLYHLNALDEEGMLTCLDLNKHTHTRIYTHIYTHITGNSAGAAVQFECPGRGGHAHKAGP
jgi:kynurenine formamidase